jgi:flagellar hook protein FlgE
MSLTGALLAGVSGLQAQSNAMGIISDNIANLNTIGYKKSDATFDTLVVNSAATTTYSPGGVQSGVQALINTQGTLQATNSPLDVSITGNGFFAVNTQGNGNGQDLYTRAGSFTQNAQGQLVNANGLYLMGWPLTSAGVISNVNQLQVVSVGTTNGVAVGTQNVTVGANVDSSQSIYTSVTDTATTGVASTTTPLTTASYDLVLTVNGSVYTLNASTGSAAFSGAAASSQTGSFSDLAGLANLINSIPGIQGAVSQSGSAFLTISSPWAVSVSGAGTGTLGLASTIAASYTAGNIQSGTVSAQFNDPIQVFDALGTAHTLNLSFVHTGTNQWAYELYDTDSDIAGVASGRGLISAGTLEFNGDGSLNSVTAYPTTLPSGATNQALYSTTTNLPVAATINWSNGASTSSIKFNLGTEGAIGTGKTDGLTQFASAFNKNFTNQDGAAVGLQTGVSIDQNGYVIASYSNGATQKLYQVPVTTFADPNKLQAQDGNAYSQTVASGNFNWRIAGTGGAGTIAPSSLEESNADLGDEFANMITTQTAYSANSKTITTANTMLQELLQIIQG